MQLLGGYLNDHGKLHVERLQLVLNELNVFETEHFEHEFADSNWYKGKQSGNAAPAIQAVKGKLSTSSWEVLHSRSVLIKSFYSHFQRAKEDFTSS